MAVFPVSIGAAALRELANALDPVLASNLRDLAQIEVATRPALDLPATQLAVDCVGQTQECLLAVTRQSGAEGLLAPELQLVGQETVVTLLYFDSHGSGEIRSVTRRYGGPQVERQALDDVPSMVRELFGIPEPEPAPRPFDSSFAGDMEAGPRQTAWPALPVVLTATGLALAGIGAGFGVAAKASEREYADIQIDASTSANVAKRRASHADETFSRAKTQALVCNIGLGVGGVALVSGAALWILHLARRDEPERLSFAPHVAPGELGLRLSGVFGQ
jgi:hypothetical protein